MSLLPFVRSCAASLTLLSPSLPPFPIQFVPLLILILDTHLLPLLTHPSAPPLLASINARLAPHLKVQKELESAKSCLDAAMRMGRAAAVRVKASSGLGGAKKGGKKGKKGGKVEKEDIGAYRLEEFAL